MRSQGRDNSSDNYLVPVPSCLSHHMRNRSVGSAHCPISNECSQSPMRATQSLFRAANGPLLLVGDSAGVIVTHLFVSLLRPTNLVAKVDLLERALELLVECFPRITLGYARWILVIGPPATPAAIVIDFSYRGGVMLLSHSYSVTRKVFISAPSNAAATHGVRRKTWTSPA